MATSSLPNARRTANPMKFAAALAAYRRADRRVTAGPTRSARSAYSHSVNRLLSVPAPDVAALAAKLDVVDPFDLDQFVNVVADARRLAGL